MGEEKGMIAKEIESYDKKLDNINKSIYEGDGGVKQVPLEERPTTESENGCCDDENCCGDKTSEETNLFNANGEMNFVKAGRSEILNFIQEKIRTKNKLEKELETIQTTYDDEILDQKVQLIQSEDIKQLGAVKERELAVEKALKDVGTEYLKELSELKERIYDINNELNIAREIYKLRTLVQ